MTSWIAVKYTAKDFERVTEMRHVLFVCLLFLYKKETIAIIT